MEYLLSACVGLGLSASSGFRVFVPMLVMSIAAQTGHLEPAESFKWVGSEQALVMFSVASLLEIGSYYVPWLDNLLDTIATPAAIIAGTVLTGAMVTDTSPVLSWSLAIIGGGGVSAVIQTGTALARQASAMTTGGLGNPVISTGEFAGSTMLAMMAIFVPLLALLTAIVFVVLVYKGAAKLLKKKYSDKSAASA